jgi:hypothetical protein
VEEEKKARMLQEPKAGPVAADPQYSGRPVKRKEVQQRDTEEVAGELARAEAAGHLGRAAQRLVAPAGGGGDGAGVASDTVQGGGAG